MFDDWMVKYTSFASENSGCSSDGVVRRWMWLMLPKRLPRLPATTRKWWDSIARNTLLRRGSLRKASKANTRGTVFWMMRIWDLRLQCMQEKTLTTNVKQIWQPLRSASGWTMTCFPRITYSQIFPEQYLLTLQPNGFTSLFSACNCTKRVPIYVDGHERMWWNLVKSFSRNWKRRTCHHHPAVMKGLPHLHQMPDKKKQILIAEDSSIMAWRLSKREDNSWAVFKWKGTHCNLPFQSSIANLIPSSEFGDRRKSIAGSTLTSSLLVFDKLWTQH